MKERPEILSRVEKSRKAENKKALLKHSMNAKLIFSLSCLAAVALTASPVNAGPRRGGGGHRHGHGHMSMQSRGGATFSRGSNWSGGNWSGRNWNGRNCEWRVTNSSLPVDLVFRITATVLTPTFTTSSPLTDTATTAIESYGSLRQPTKATATTATKATLTVTAAKATATATKVYSYSNGNQGYRYSNGNGNQGYRYSNGSQRQAQKAQIRERSRSDQKGR